MFQCRQRLLTDLFALVLEGHLLSDRRPVEKLGQFIQKLTHVFDVVEADAKLQRFGAYYNDDISLCGITAEIQSDYLFTDIQVVHRYSGCISAILN